MQARIETRPLPSRVVMFVFAILLALILGVGLGYAIKPVNVAGGPVRTVVLPVGAVNDAGDACQFVDKHKAC